jgi:hypothetical protein
MMSYIFDIESHSLYINQGQTVVEMTFQEKSLWLIGGSLVMVFGLYFWWVLPAPAVDVRPDQVALFGGMVALLVVLQVAGHTLIAIRERRTHTDERDRLIGLIGQRNGGFVLATGVFMSLCVAVFTSGNFLFTHVLLAFWVLAELTSVGTALWLYRHGV